MQQIFSQQNLPKLLPKILKYKESKVTMGNALAPRKMLHASKTEVDMSQGDILILLINFATPLLLGNIFQQLYNTVDTWVVGNYVGKNAFSAVGTLNPIINTLIGFFMGFSNGACVIIARHFGAGDKDKVSRAVHTFVAVTLILCVVFTVLGLLLTPYLLTLIKSPVEVRTEQSIYLSIYFMGVSGLLLYNMGSAILRAVGNSLIPFIFLVISALLNIVLDLLFVIKFNLGTAGVAYATILSQMISAVLVLILLVKTDSSVKLKFSKICIDFQLLKSIFIVGLPSAIQMSITAFSNIFVQSYINYFGSDVMGGWTAYSKLDQLLFLPMQSLALATQTFVSQNLGRRFTERAKKGVVSALLSSIVCTIILIIPVIGFAPKLVKFFIDDNETEVIRYGTMFLRMISPFYVACCFNQIFGGALRGAGKSTVSMVIMLGSFVFARQLYLYITANFISNTVVPISMGYPFGWILCSLLMLISYKVCFKEKNLYKTEL